MWCIKPNQDTIEKKLRDGSNLFVRLGLSAILAASPFIYSGCSPIDVYRTIQIRHEEPDLYKTYKKIDMNKLTEQEQGYLDRMHQKYGGGPIEAYNLSDELSKEWIKNFTYLTGHKEFTDKDLIFIHRSLPGIVGGLLLHIDGQ